MKKSLAFIAACSLLLACTPVIQPEQKDTADPQEEEKPQDEKPQDETPPEETPPEETPSEPLALSFSMDSPDPETAWSLGGTATAHITCPDAWTLSSSESWLQVEPASGPAGEFVVTLSTPANPTAEDREAVVTLTSGTEGTSTTLVQHGNIFRSRVLRTRKVKSVHTLHCSSGINRLKYRVFLPYAETNQYQTIRDVEYGEGVLETSPQGVKYLRFFKDYQPSKGDIKLEHTYTVDFQYLETDFSKIARRDLPYDTESPAYKRYTSRCTADAGFQMIDPLHPWVVSTANELWAQADGDRIEFARLCYEKVASAFRYEGFDGDNSVDEIIDRMAGDCGNQHAIWLSLVRNKGIPARPVVMNSPDGFCHVRGEFCVAGYGWIPVDVTYHQGGGDYWGKFTDDHLVVMNRDFSFDTVPVDGEGYHINLLQVIHWFYWYWGSGEVTADYEFKYR